MTNNRAERLGNEDVGKLLWSLSFPAILGMLAISIYNIADTIFIGRGVGTMGIAGISISLPLLMAISTFGNAIGLGGASVISRALGANNYKKANLALNNLLTLIIVLNIITCVIAYLNLPILLKLFGADDEILPYALEYTSWAMPGTFFLNILFVLMNVIRSEGNARFPMISQTIAAALNLIIDPIFIFVFEWGLMGAALATTISQFTGMMLSIWYYTLNNKSVLKLDAKLLMTIPDKKITIETFAIGASSFGRQIASSVMNIVLNHSLLFYAGSSGIAAFGIVFRLAMFVFMPLFGINQGFMPVAGYNYGAKRMDRVLEALRKSNIRATVFCVIAMFAFYFFATDLVKIFTTDTVLIETGTRAIRIFIVAFPVVGFQIIGSGLYQALGKAKASFFLAIARQVLFLIPFALLFPLQWGENGIWLSFPAADFLSAIITFFMVLHMTRKLKSEIKFSAQTVPERR